MKFYSLTGLDKKRLAILLTLFFTALLVPSVILIYQSYSQLKWESFHQHRIQAQELTARIDNRLAEWVVGEQRRTFFDYSFLLKSTGSNSNVVQLSPLSNYPVASAIPGVIGHFQVDEEGFFSTPLMPSLDQSYTDYGIADDEFIQRKTLQQRIQQILSQNRLVTPAGHTQLSATRQQRKPTGLAKASRVEEGEADSDLLLEANDARQPAKEGRASVSEQMASAPSPASLPATQSPSRMPKQQSLAQSAFDQLNRVTAGFKGESKQRTMAGLGRVEDLKLEKRYQAEFAEQSQVPFKDDLKMTVGADVQDKKKVAKAMDDAPANMSTVKDEQEQEKGVRIHTFESATDPFEFSLLDSGHFVLFRKVWRDGQRYIQGLLIDPQPLFKGLIESAFFDTSLARMSDLVVAYRGDVLSAVSGERGRDYLSSTSELRGELLFQSRLPAPLADMTLIFSVRNLPAGPGGEIIQWVALILLIILCVGFYSMYRLGVRQIDLAHQQQDFVSAVSHELKTPLTSIRMYAEMLREGWASEEKKTGYYNFIHDESERLSRLINNVLQLARMTRNELQIELSPYTVAQLMDLMQSKISTQVAQAGFELVVEVDSELAQQRINVDPDSLSQILINLVDNAIKFSAKAVDKRIQLGCCPHAGNRVVFTIRDFGPGIPRDQMKKIFQLFYRSENELSRETVGTGIGLALVSQLALAMHARVDVLNRDPGAEFILSFQAL